jgi:hypothetical protein
MRLALQAIAAMPVSDEHPLEVVVREPRREKSQEQRGLWHAILGDIAQEMGHTPGEMKQIVKAEYYGTDWVTLPSGHRYEVIQSSEDADRGEYSRLIDFTMRFAAENGIVIPDRRKLTME